MDSEKNVFKISGPTHLTQVDWGSEHHRRSVAASLVQGVYVLESDRQQSRQEHEALAPPWWEFFDFQLLGKLVDGADSSIFGAVYELAKPPCDSSGEPPGHVVALRGTVNKAGSISRDLELDLQIVRQGLHCTTRFAIAMQAVRDLARSQRSKSTIWLAGHSLGAALATLAGKTAVREEGVLIETYLFNPPFVAAPIEKIKDKKLKHGLRIAGSFVAAGLALAAKAQGRERRSGGESAFSALATWVPRLFVNPSDVICSEYVGYFEHREKMEELGIGHVERIATQHSIGGLILGAVFGEDCDPVHLLPSADLTVNLGPSPDLKTAHGVHQWWRPDLNLKRSVHLYRE